MLSACVKLDECAEDRPASVERDDTRPRSRRAGTSGARSGARGTRPRRVPRPPDLPLDLPPRRDRRRGDDRPVARRCARRLRDEFTLDDPDARASRDVVRRHREVSPAARRRPADRIGVHPGHAGDDLLHLDAGRLRDGVRLLPDRQDGARPEPDGRRNRRPGARARRRARHARHAASTSC